MIIRGGENVYSMEVENALYEHPAVMEAAVIGIPDRVLGELVGAVVISKPGQKVTMNELIEHCKARIGAFKVPVFIDVRSPVPVPGNVDAYEGLPKNATGEQEKVGFAAIFVFVLTRIGFRLPSTGKVLKKDMKKDLEAKYVKYLSSKGSKA